jgi:hypothetical protein
MSKPRKDDNFLVLFNLCFLQDMGKYVCEIEGITTAAYLDVEGK